MKLGKWNAQPRSLARCNDGGDAPDLPQGSRFPIFADARKAEGYKHDWPTSTVSDNEFNVAVWLVYEPDNDLRGLSLIRFPSITQKNGEAKEQ